MQRHDGPVGPFFRRVAEELDGARLARLAQVRGDRIVRLEFRDTSSGEPRGLIAELVGRHANLVLVGGADRVLEILVPPPERAGHEARLVVGRAWEAPPGQARGGGPSLEEELGAPAPPNELARLAPLSWAVEAALGGSVADDEKARRRKQLADRIARKRKRAKSLIAGLERKRDAAGEVERVRMDGELLKGALDRIPRGADHVELPDYYTDGAPPRRIALDPKLAPRENVDRVFQRARKLERSGADVERELELARDRQRALARLAEALAADDADLDALESVALEQRLLDPPQAPPRKKRPEPAARLPYRTFEGSAGSPIRVGKTARDNDELTLKRSNGNDVWLHTADCPGSHVVLRLKPNAQPDPEEVLDAAHLAVHFSPLRGASRADVHVARCKEVRKPKGAKPGLVTLSGGRTMHVRVEERRLRRLLSPERARREEGGADSVADPRGGH